ncbi:MAG: TIGR04255 family protein [Brucella anthropi]
MLVEVGEAVSFVPRSGEHALTEVVFGVTFSRLLNQTEIEAVVASHDVWKQKLPRMSRIAAVEFAFGEVPPTDMPQHRSAGVIFDRYKPDGTLDLRLRVDETGLFVNCLTYTRWAEVWREAFDLMSQVSRFIRGEAFISSVILQCVDVFDWDGAPAEYDLHLLLKENPEVIPLFVFDSGLFWHSHHGRFFDASDDRGRLLQRVQLDGIEDQDSKPIVKLEIYLQLQFARDMAPHADSLGSYGMMNELFDPLHDRQKEIASSYLSGEICNRIGLNG